MLQQDGGTCFTAVSTKEFLKANKIRTLERWPAQSLDLNIIEQMWAYLKKAVKAKNPSNTDDLWTIATKEWEENSN